MKANDFVVREYQEPVGYVGRRCGYCGEWLEAPNSVLLEARFEEALREHLAMHVAAGELERRGEGYVLVIGKPPRYTPIPPVSEFLE